VRDRPIREVRIEPYASEDGEPRRNAVPLKASGTKPPLFMLPGEVGQVFHFKRVAERLREDIPLIGMEAPGLYGDQEPFEDIDELAAHFIREMRRIQPEGPYLIGGFSAGVITAYAMGVQLAGC